MDFNSVVEKRRSVRSFKSKPASWRDVIEAIDTARQIPLAGNINTLKFVVTQDHEKITKISELCGQKWIIESGIVVIVCSDDSVLEKLYGERGRIYNRQQTGAAVQNFLLKLVDLKLSGCWVGSFDDKEIRKLFDIPKKTIIEAIIPVGYEKNSPSKKRKPSPENITFWEKWDEKKMPPFFKEPDYRTR